MTPDSRDVPLPAPETTSQPSARAAVSPVPSPVAAHPPRRWLGPLVGIGIVAIAASIAVLFTTRWDSWVGSRIAQTTDDAYVKGDITPLSAKIEGYVRNVAVGDYESVKAGELLVEIEDDDYHA